MKTHELKTDPLVFAAVVAGLKTHEIRFDDRGFEVGDRLRLRETRASGAEMREGDLLVYTGRELTRTVSHIQLGYGLAPGWCILSFRTANFATEAPPAPVAQPATERELAIAKAVSAATYNATRRNDPGRVAFCDLNLDLPAIIAKATA